ncbi:MAG: SpoIID/LytB domain-containing protein [Acidobacteria bacterium]|nr:SpoIID/LytB domain-containing protein [Acidobacteriota bacterium]
MGPLRNTELRSLDANLRFGLSLRLMFFKAFSIFAATVFVFSGTASADPILFRLPAEPLIRIGLATNASQVSITTSDPSLVAFSPDEPSRMLASNRVSISARAYNPPEIEQFRIEFQNLPSQVDANSLADDVRAAVGESAIASIDVEKNTWRVWVGGIKATEEEALELKQRLADKDLDDAVVVVEKKQVVSPDAIALTRQVRDAKKSEVRSLVRTTGSAKLAPGESIDPNLREVIVSGSSEESKFSSLKTVAFGSLNERSTPVRLNGKAYRGKIEVFVNASGRLSVVNVVPLEDYLLGVVPSELSLPQLEAQKAQAVAARTYAIANIGGYGTKGFDMVPTVYSQVYKGVSIETAMGTRAVRETRGMVATYKGEPIMAYFTSTCGGRTEDGVNIFGKDEPYLKGVECSLEGRRHFDPFTIRTSRTPAKLRDGSHLELTRLMSRLAANGAYLSAAEMTDDWFDSAPNATEMANWLGQIASKLGKPLPSVSNTTARPLEAAAVLAKLFYEPRANDTLLSNSDVLYQLSFDDAADVPAAMRPDLAALLRDGYFRLRPDLTLKPNMPFTRAEFLSLIGQIYAKKKWLPDLQKATAKPAADGKISIGSGRSARSLTVRPDVFLFRQFGETLYPVREVALVGGEDIAFQTDATGAVAYLEVQPTSSPTAAENMSPFTNWNKTVSASALQSRLSRYVRGIGTLYDVNVKKVGYSRRPIEIEIVGSNGIKTLSGGKIRSALRLPEQLFVMNKRYNGNTVASYTFTGRGWGHGVGMCQYGAYGMAKMGVKYDEIIKHYYTGVDLTKAY